MATTAVFDPVKYKETTRQQWQAAAQAWYSWGPTLEQWLGEATEIMLDMATAGPGSDVLDIAAGAGGQTAAAARRVGASGSVLATDISANILTYAAQAARAGGLENVETRVMDGEEIDLPAGTYDAVISRVGLIYFPDQQKALTGMHRVLKPGGKAAAVVYSTAQNNPFFSIPVAIIRQRAQLPPPLPGQPGPFSLGNPGVLEAAFTRAGFSQVETRLVPAPLRLPSTAECVRFERESFGALHQMLSALPEAQQNAVWDEILQELSQFESNGEFSGPCELVIGAGVKE
jgi:ubiquinone/menaquinone biosynthesis C-methylase UbiE